MKSTLGIKASVLTIASMIVGAGIAMAGSLGHDARVVYNWVPNLANDYTIQTNNVAATCRQANQTAARAAFSRQERKLDAKLAVGHYSTLVNGKLVQVTSPTYDDLVGALDNCPKG